YVAVGIILHFVDGGGAEVLTRVAVFARAAVVANVVIGNDEVWRLVLFVVGRRVVHVRQLVEGEAAIRLQHVDGLAVKLGEGFHALVARPRRVARPDASSARYHLQRGVERPGPEAVLE